MLILIYFVLTWKVVNSYSKLSPHRECIYILGSKDSSVEQCYDRKKNIRKAEMMRKLIPTARTFRGFMEEVTSEGSCDI